MEKLLFVAFILLTQNSVQMNSIGQDGLSEQTQVGVGTNTYQLTRTGQDEQIFITEVSGEEQKCTLFDACRVCSFKELQGIPECQETGFRMILKCLTTLADDKSDIREETYHDVSCQEAPTEFSSLEDGVYAKYGSGPNSVYWFCFITSVLAYIMFKILDRRREGILKEVYSKVSIIKTQN